MHEIESRAETQFRNATIEECAALKREIDRLRKALERTRPHVRDEIIEECARVVEALPYTSPDELKRIADDIRALKSKAS